MVGTSRIASSSEKLVLIVDWIGGVCWAWMMNFFLVRVGYGRRCGNLRVSGIADGRWVDVLVLHGAILAMLVFWQFMS